jgi:lipoprotein signal peptidase
MMWLGFLAGLVVLAVDQASKAWILFGLELPAIGNVDVLPFLSLTFVQNRGVTFGLLNDFGALGTWVLTVIALAVVVALVMWMRRAESRMVAAALGAIAGGAIGNVMDRLRFGWVVDFIHAHAGGWSWYVFNVADAAIMCGVGLLVLDSLRTRQPGPASCE